MRKNGIGQKKGSILLVALFLTLSVILSGCGKLSNIIEDKLPSGEEESEVETSSEETIVEEDTAGIAAKTFAARAAGTYRCELSHDESCLMTLCNVNGNLYAYCGNAMKEDGEDTIYSFYAVEIIPTSAGQFLDSNITSAEAGFLVFSEMSNFTKYWDKPRLGTLTLTDDGIKISCENAEDSPLFSDMKEMEFVKDSSVASHFAYNEEYLSGFEKQEMPEDICGLWTIGDVSDNVFFEIGKGNSNSLYGMQIYRKQSGEEVYLGRGYIAMDDQNVFHAYFNVLHSNAPMAFDFTYEKKDDDTMELTTDSLPGFGPAFSEGVTVLKRAEKEDIPLVTFFKPDDSKAYETSQFINAPDMTNRSLTVQMLASDDVENNGGYFVRVGDFVFYRYYPNENMPNLDGYDGNFLLDSDQCKTSAICYYDTQSGKSGVACKDGGYGPLYYVNGKFVTQVYDATDAYSVQHIMAYYPNGGGAEYLQEESFNSIIGVSELGDYIAWDNFHSGRVCISNVSSKFLQEYEHVSYEDVMVGAGFCHGKLVCVTQNDESGFLSFEMIDPATSEKDLIGGFAPKKKHKGYPKLENMMWEEGDLYIGIAWFSQEFILNDFTVFKINTLSDDEPEVVYDDYPEVCKNGGEPYFTLNYADEILLRNCDDNCVSLSNISYGDLVWNDSQFSAVMIAKNYIENNPYEAKAKDTVQILQKAEHVGDAVYIITADAYAMDDVQSADFDRYTDFEWKAYHYSRIPVDSVENDGNTYNEEPLKADNLAVYEKIKISGEETPEAKGPFAGKSAQEAFNKVISLYSTALEEGWDRDKAAEEGLSQAVYDYGWPQDYKTGGNGGYAFMDINNDGTDELLIIHDNSLISLYGYNGTEAVLSFGRMYRHEVFLYEDGMIQVLFGTMNDAAEYWYRYHPLSGNTLPVVEKTYEPTNNDPKDVKCYVYSAELNPDEVDRIYLQGGMFPVWAYEWGDEITEKEFDTYTSKAKEVKLPKPTAF